MFPVSLHGLAVSHQRMLAPGDSITCSGRYLDRSSAGDLTFHEHSLSSRIVKTG